MKKDEVAPTITLGRNFMNVALFKKFLKESRHLFDEAVYKKLNSDKDRCLTGSPIIEVTVRQICDNGLAECHFFGRGVNIETLYAPAECLRAIKPVLAKVTAVKHNERDFYAGGCRV